MKPTHQQTCSNASGGALWRTSSAFSSDGSLEEHTSQERMMMDGVNDPAASAHDYHCYSSLDHATLRILQQQADLDACRWDGSATLRSKEEASVMAQQLILQSRKQSCRH
jgi:hypothetical protein